MQTIRSILSRKDILITGGSGSLGHALTEELLKMPIKKIRIFSRDELKQSQMESKFNDKRLRFFIGDVRDQDRVKRAMEGVDIVFHAAALKHVPVAEYNPFEAVKTNVVGAQNVIDACLQENVEKVIAISSDKAVSPLNTYGATKLLMEKLFVAANHYKGNRKTTFTCVRYGNVLGSRGSVVPKFIDQIKKNGSITVTDPKMTRFNITMPQAIHLIFDAVTTTQGGEIFIPKLAGYYLKDIKDAIVQLIRKKVTESRIPVRGGEKYHEILINNDEIRNTLESKKNYIILDVNDLTAKKRHYAGYANTRLQDEYSSKNVNKLSKTELMKIIKEERLIQ